MTAKNPQKGGRPWNYCAICGSAMVWKELHHQRRFDRESGRETVTHTPVYACAKWVDGKVGNHDNLVLAPISNWAHDEP